MRGMNRRDITARFRLVLAGAGLAAVLTSALQSRSATILSHDFKLSGRPLFVFLGLWALWSAALFLGARALAGRAARLSGVRDDDGFQDVVRASTPLLVLLFAPTLQADYLTRSDLQSRLGILFGLALAGSVYLWTTRTRPARETPPSRPRKPWDRFLSLPLRRRLVVLFLAAFLVYSGSAALLVLEGVTFSGDEPNYLLTSHSLLFDGDINVFNNHAGRDYFHFYARQDNPRLKMGIYARQGKRGQGHIYPINLPGISALMVPFYGLSQLAGEGFLRTFLLKVSLAVWAVLLGLQLYLLARDLWGREKLALGLWALYAFSTPVLFYAVHLYPEIPIACFSAYIYRMVRKKRPLRNGHLLFFGALLGTFFWFGLKYNFVFWPLLAVAAFSLWTVHKMRARILLLAVPALLGLAAFSFAVWDMYGTLSPFAVYEGTISSEEAQNVTNAFLELPLASRVETFFDYFLDQRDGLFLYAPFYLFALLGLVEMARRARRELVGLLLIAGPFVLNYAFFTHRQGYCPQARVLAPVSWVGAVAVGYFLAHNGRRMYRWLFGAAAAAGAAVSVLLLRHPSFLYQATTYGNTQRAGDLFVLLSNIRLFLPDGLPSFIKVKNTGYLPNYFWTAAMAVFILVYILTKNRDRGRLPAAFHGAAAAAVLAAGVFLWVLFPRTVLYPSWAVRYSSGGALGFYMMPMGRGVVAKNEGEMYLHFAKPYRFLFSSRTPLEAVKLKYGSLEGEHEIRVGFFDLPLFEARTAGEMAEKVFAPAASYRWRSLYVYDLTVELKKFSGENLLEDPYFFQVVPVRKN
jgi:hypothetical protein